MYNILPKLETGERGGEKRSRGIISWFSSFLGKCLERGGNSNLGVGKESPKISPMSKAPMSSLVVIGRFGSKIYILVLIVKKKKHITLLIVHCLMQMHEFEFLHCLDAKRKWEEWVDLWVIWKKEIFSIFIFCFYI